MDEYMLEHQKGNGTFSIVFMAVSTRTGEKVAIKCMKKKFDSLQNVTKLKEIQALKILSSHKHIIKLIEVLFDQPTGKLALVFQLMEMNLYQALKNKKAPMSLKKIKFYMFQVLLAINHMHQKGIFHRDIKPQNILVKDDHVKLADLGSCKGKYSPYPYTEYISTRWYRAPECLMTDGYYNQKMDIWGFGCVLFELITKYPLFPGKDELDQVHKIHNILGTPKQQILERFKNHATHMQFNFPHKKGSGLDRHLNNSISSDTRDLLHKLLAYDPLQRISAEDALKHQFFSEFYLNLNNNFRNSRGGGFGKGWNKTSGQSDEQQMKNHGNSFASKDKKGGKQTKRQGGGSKVNLQRADDEGILPRIPNPTFYGKKTSQQLNFTAFLQGKKMG